MYIVTYLGWASNNRISITGQHANVTWQLWEWPSSGHWAVVVNLGTWPPRGLSPTFLREQAIFVNITIDLNIVKTKRYDTHGNLLLGLCSVKNLSKPHVNMHTHIRMHTHKYINIFT